MMPLAINYQEWRHKATQWLTTTMGQLFVGLTLVPTILTAIYLYLLAPDRYISVAQLSVYDSTIAQASSDIFSSLGLGTGQSNTDLQLLQAYLESPELLKLADEELEVKAHYSNNLDFVFGLSSSAAFEDFHSFFLNRAYTQIDPETGLLTITTEGYTPEFSLQLNQLLVREGEQIINQLNQDVARTEMAFAEEEIARSLKILQDQQSALADFQSSTQVASPESEGESLISIIYGMEASLAEAKAQLGETLTYLSPESPQARSLNAKINALENQIDAQKARITNSQDGEEAFSRLGIEYNELRFKVELARVIYESAVSSYELSRSQSTKKLKHLLVPSAPTLPEKPSLPNRGYWLITFALIYLCLFGVARMVYRSIQEHQD